MSRMKFKETRTFCQDEFGASIKDTIISLRDDGWSQLVIAGVLNITPVTLRMWCKRFEITFNRKDLRKECCGGHYSKGGWTKGKKRKPHYKVTKHEMMVELSKYKTQVEYRRKAKIAESTIVRRFGEFKEPHRIATEFEPDSKEWNQYIGG